MGPGVQAQGGGGGGGGAERQVAAATAAFTVCWLLRAVKFEGFLLFEVKASRAKGNALPSRVASLPFGVAPTAVPERHTQRSGGEGADGGVLRRGVSWCFTLYMVFIKYGFLI